LSETIEKAKEAAAEFNAFLSLGGRADIHSRQTSVSSIDIEEMMKNAKESARLTVLRGRGMGWEGLQMFYELIEDVG
jgi:hypothetical protein